MYIMSLHIVLAHRKCNTGVLHSVCVHVCRPDASTRKSSRIATRRDQAARARVVLLTPYSPTRDRSPTSPPFPRPLLPPRFLLRSIWLVVRPFEHRARSLSRFREWHSCVDLVEEGSPENCHRVSLSKPSFIIVVRVRRKNRVRLLSRERIAFVGRSPVVYNFRRRASTNGKYNNVIALQFSLCEGEGECKEYV